MRNLGWCVAFVAMLTAGVNSAWASFLSINNPSFESQSLSGAGGSGNFIIGTLTGWVLTAPSGTGTGTQGVFKPGAAQYPGGIPNGVNVAFSNGGTISQVLTAALAPSTSYLLSVDVGDRLLLSFPAYRIELVAGSTVLASTTMPNPADGGFATATVSFLTSATHTNLGQLLQIRLINNGGAQINYDNVRLDAQNVVPEPSGMILFGTGLAGFLACKRRRQKVSAT